MLTPLFLILWAVFLFGGFIFGKLCDDRSRRMPAWTRMASSLMLVFTAWELWWVVSTNQNAIYGDAAQTWLIIGVNDTFTFLIAVGMTLGFIGDLFMAGWIGGEPNPMGGIGAFGLGHIAYITGMIHYANGFGLHGEARLYMWIVCALIGVIGWLIAVYIGAKRQKIHIGKLHYAALIYALLLSSTLGVAAGLALFQTGFIVVAVGAALFLTSDLIIAARLFNKAHFMLIDDVVWLTYGPAQAMIVTGATFAFLFQRL